MNIDENQIISLLRQPSEGLQVEVKNWLDPRIDKDIAKLIKAIFAISNRNGGFLVIGFNDENLIPEAYTLDEHVNTLYHIDRIQALVSRYATSPIEIAVEVRDRDGQLHPIIAVPDGVRVPVIVKRDLIANGGKRLLHEGDIYFRTLLSNGTPSSARILPADYPELLEICFENREADIGRFLRRHLSGIDVPLTKALRSAVTGDPRQGLRERSLAVIHRGGNAFSAAVNQSAKVSEFQKVREALTLRVGLALDPPKLGELPNREFMNKVSASNPQYTGWPPWQDSRSFSSEEYRPYVSDGAWEAIIVNLDGGWNQHFEFWRFGPTGEFYLQRVMQDDFSQQISPGTAMDVVLMIYRVAEVLAVGTSMARTLGWKTNAKAGFAFQWTGLNGRALSSWARPIHWIDSSGGQSRTAAEESFVEVPIEIPHSALAPHVGSAVGPLFAAFDGYTASQELIESCIRKMIERKMNT